jgi:hypothetical protein
VSEQASVFIARELDSEPSNSPEARDQRAKRPFVERGKQRGIYQK